MSSSIRGIPRRRSAGRLAAGLLLAALAVSGCGNQVANRQAADTTRGKELFSQKCGSCHVLEDAGTAGQIGPNLDDAFRQSRAQGFATDTFFEVTLEQMKIPALPMPDFDDAGDKANYLPDEDLVSIAAYVADVAANPGEGAAAGPQGDDPKSIFTSSCGGCHTLGDAGTTGSVGPNLDDVKPELESAVTQIKNGGNGMPAFEGRLTDEQIRALAEYIVKAPGG
ncbi:MAG: c-type cytochrome [Actinobacteria bacterium]|nr:c-type cytochrome [Actinomycetota bacterium]